MIQREIFEVNARIVDANGTYNLLSGYPKAFDSKNYNNDIDKTLRRAQSDYHEILAAMGKRDDRQLQRATLIRLGDDAIIDSYGFGALADLPDPEPDGE